MKTCLECEKYFEPKFKKSKFCSQKCLKKNYNIRIRSGEQRVKYGVCGYCKKRFPFNGKYTKKFCSHECTVKCHTNLDRKKFDDEKRQRKIDLLKFGLCQNCKILLSNRKCRCGDIHGERVEGKKLCRDCYNLGVKESEEGVSREVMVEQVKAMRKEGMKLKEIAREFKVTINQVNNCLR